MARPKGSKNKIKDYIKINPLDEIICEMISEEASNINSIKGWINIYRQEGAYSINYYTGSDIYLTKDLAKSTAQKNCIGQVYINLEY